MRNAHIIYGLFQGSQIVSFPEVIAKPLSTRSLKAGKPYKLRVESWESGQTVWYPPVELEVL